MPTHDRPRSCETAVRSALAQEPPPAEVLVCDDGSGEPATEHLRLIEALDPAVRVLRSERSSGGPARPRNAGVAAARNELVAFLDDDDEWLPGKLAAQVPLMSDFALVASDAIRMSTGERYLGSVETDPDHRALLAENTIITSTVVVRRSCLQRAGGFPEHRRMRGIEDYAAWLAIAASGERVHIVDQGLARYRDAGADRFGARGSRVHAQLAELHARRWLRKPSDLSRLRAAASSLVTGAREAR